MMTNSHWLSTACLCTCRALKNTTLKILINQVQNLNIDASVDITSSSTNLISRSNQYGHLCPFDRTAVACQNTGLSLHR
ncbi:hypothetical protein SMMN14_00967, partial [Sphaerulina musiva]